MEIYTDSVQINALCDISTNTFYISMVTNLSKKRYIYYYRKKG